VYEIFWVFHEIHCCNFFPNSGNTRTGQLQSGDIEVPTGQHGRLQALLSQQGLAVASWVIQKAGIRSIRFGANGIIAQTTDCLRWLQLNVATHAANLPDLKISFFSRTFHQKVFEALTRSPADQT